MNLFISLYNEKNPDRLKELQECAEKNSKLFETIYILNEDRQFYVNQSDLDCWLGQKFIDNRTTFKDLVAYVNSITKRNDINIISNSDIFFDETLEKANQIKKDECYAICRQNMPPNYLAGSQDSWIFRGKIIGNDYNYPIGFPGSDHRFAFGAHKAGYTVTNPCLSINTWHNHKEENNWYKTSKIEMEGVEYDEKRKMPVVSKPYKLVPPCAL